MTKRELEALKHEFQEQWSAALFEQRRTDDRGHFTPDSRTPGEKRAIAEHYKLLALGGRMMVERFLDAVRKSDNVCENYNLVASWVAEIEKKENCKLRPKAKIEVIEHEKN